GAAVVRGERKAARGDEMSAQVSILQCVFGNPFRRIAVDPAWLSWRDGTIRRLSQAQADGSQGVELVPINVAARQRPTAGAAMGRLALALLAGERVSASEAWVARSRSRLPERYEIRYRRHRPSGGRGRWLFQVFREGRAWGYLDADYLAGWRWLNVE